MLSGSCLENPLQIRIDSHSVPDCDIIDIHLLPGGIALVVVDLDTVVGDYTEGIVEVAADTDLDIPWVVVDNDWGLDNWALDYNLEVGIADVDSIYAPVLYSHYLDLCYCPIFDLFHHLGHLLCPYYFYPHYHPTVSCDLMKNFLGFDLYCHYTLVCILLDSHLYPGHLGFENYLRRRVRGNVGLCLYRDLDNYS